MKPIATEGAPMKLRQVRMPADLWERTRQHARRLSMEEGQSVAAADVVRRALDAYLPPVQRRG